MVKPSRLLLLGGAILLAILLGLAGILEPVGNILRRIGLPVIRATTEFVAPITTRWNWLSRQPNEVERLDVLENRLTKLAIDYARLKALEEENAALRAQAKFLSTSGYDSVGARVISRSIGNGRALLMIDRGLIDTVEKGQAVLTRNGIFIGKISAISERVATVELLTDPDSRVASALAGDQKLIGVLEGRGNGAAVLTYIPSSQAPKRDQIVVTSGTEEKVPAYLPLGVINAVEGKPTDPFINASVEPLIGGDRVTFVSVLRPSALNPKP